VQSKPIVKEPIIPNPHAVRFHRYPNTTISLPWKYDDNFDNDHGVKTQEMGLSSDARKGHLFCNVTRNSVVRKPTYDRPTHRGFTAKPMLKESITHDIQLRVGADQPDEDTETGFVWLPTGTVRYTRTTESVDEFKKHHKGLDGSVGQEVSHATVKAFSGVFGLASSNNYFDLLLIMTDDETGKMECINFKCSHHPLTNKQWPAVDNSEADPNAAVYHEEEDEECFL